VLLSGHDAEVVFSSPSYEIEPMCTNWVAKQAAGGDLWIENGPISNLDVSQVCALTVNGGAATAQVYDSGGAMYGQQACTGLLAAGWTEQSAPAVPYQ
jgi:hypothetical protein